MVSSEVRVRIAPSPTGYFHVGTARTAIYNWLLARKLGGKFLLRIEDTDRERSKKEYVDIILDGLKWLGLDWDEEIVFQSARIMENSYRLHIDKLLEEGKAYRCFYLPDKLKSEREKAREEKRNFKARKYRDIAQEEVERYMQDGRSFTVRLKLPTEGEAMFHDEVSGEVRRSYNDLDDLIIMKSDGAPIYNFAVVVDDHDMAISHVIRGNDHITNTFYQVEIYRALGWNIPQFAHLPMILRPDRSKVSKRKGDKGVTEYRADGYLPQALMNYAALVGWSPKDDREKMSVDELIESFSIEGINPNNAIFDIEKLNWMNGEYLREMDSNKLIELVSPYLIEAGLTTKYWIETNWHWTVRVIDALKKRCRLLTEYVELGHYFFKSDFDYDSKGVRKHFKAEGAAGLLQSIREEFAQMSKWSKDNLEMALRDLADRLEVKPARLIHPTRLAVSGMTKGPGLFDILELLGETEVQKRIDRAIVYIEKGEFPEQEDV
jgi:glutamyl-tRNA synthetase